MLIVKVIPTLCLIAVSLRVLYDIIFKNKTTDFMYRHMLTFEISDTIIGTKVGFMGVFDCASYCNFSYNFKSFS